MDHSYSTERDRLQKTDHCYFTVGKKTPQVVLRKALRRDHILDGTKSSVGQDHSYVRPEHAVCLGSFDTETQNQWPVGLGSATRCCQLQQSDNRQESVDDTVGVPCCLPAESNVLSGQTAQGHRETNAEVSSVWLAAEFSSSSVDVPTPPRRRSDLDDLRSWMSCCQLDHTYDCQQRHPLSGSQPQLDHAYDGYGSLVGRAGSFSSSQPHLDHAYDGLGFQCRSRQLLDHAYNADDSSREEDADDSLYVCDVVNTDNNRVQLLDHAYESHDGDHSLVTDAAADEKFAVVAERVGDEMSPNDGSSGHDGYAYHFDHCYGAQQWTESLHPYLLTMSTPQTTFSSQLMTFSTGCMASFAEKHIEPAFV